jgi:hypothetical protein
MADQKEMHPQSKAIIEGKAEIILNGQRNFPFTELIRLWKTQYDGIPGFKRGEIIHPFLEGMGDYVAEKWDTIEPITAAEAFAVKNVELRRAYFTALGPRRIMEQVKPTLRNTQTISKTRTRWDKKNKPYESKFEDTYNLYEIDPAKLFEGEQRVNRMAPIFTVQCKCTTTGREYWLYVSPEGAIGQQWTNGIDAKKLNYDAIRAIAWTIQLNITHPKRLFRQGDIIVAEWSDLSQRCDLYHIDAATYLKLMYSET